MMLRDAVTSAACVGLTASSVRRGDIHLASLKGKENKTKDRTRQRGRGVTTF